MTIIRNADDYGMSEATNRAILRSIREEGVNSTSVCVTQLTAPAGLAEEVKRLEGIQVGVHLSLTEGRPAGDGAGIAPMLTREGKFRPAIESLRSEAELRVEGIREELRAQLDRFRALVGREPSHLDCHQHFAYLSPRAFRALLDLAENTGIPIRSPRPFLDPRRLQGFSDRVKRSYGVDLPFVPQPHAALLRSLFLGARAPVRTDEVILDGEACPDAGASLELVLHPR